MSEFIDVLLILLDLAMFFYFIYLRFFFIDTCIDYRLKLELHFSLIAAAVAYILWRSVGESKKSGIFQSRLHKQLSVADRSGLNGSGTLDQRRKGNWRVDCQGASKGLFLGLLSLVAGIIVLIIFFVMKVRPSP